MAGDITQVAIRDTNITMFALTVIVIVVRLVASKPHWSQWRHIQMADFWLALCFLFFVAEIALYHYIVASYYWLIEVETKEAQGTLTGVDMAALAVKFEKEGVFLQKGMFAVSLCLWLCLWSAKFSLLSMYRKLHEGLPRYQYIWWALVAFTALVRSKQLKKLHALADRQGLVGCLISLCLSCHSMAAWFVVNGCTSQHEVTLQVISLWYSYAVDVLTDLMIMALPIRLILGLQMRLCRKLSICALFCLGIVCITFSTLRVIKVNGGTEAPSVPWLALWGVVEAAVAVVIANAPGFYRLIKRRAAQQRYHVPDDEPHLGGSESASTPRRPTAAYLGFTSRRFRNHEHDLGLDTATTTTITADADQLELKAYIGSECPAAAHSPHSPHSSSGDRGSNGSSAGGSSTLGGIGDGNGDGNGDGSGNGSGHGSAGSSTRGNSTSADGSSQVDLVENQCAAYANRRIIILNTVHVSRK